MKNLSDDKLFVAQQDGTALAVVVGKGSFRMGTSLKQFGMQAIESNCSRIIINLATCSTIDSTFMGIAARLATRIRQRGRGTLVLINLNIHTRKQLQSLGLHDLLEHYSREETPGILEVLFRGFDQLAQADANEESGPKRTETMIEAHQTLVDLDPANIPKFRDVLAYLRDDLERRSGE